VRAAATPGGPRTIDLESARLLAPPDGTDVAPDDPVRVTGEGGAPPRAEAAPDGFTASLARARAADASGSLETVRPRPTGRPGAGEGAPRSPPGVATRPEEARGPLAAEVPLADAPAVAPPTELSAVARALPPAVAALAGPGRLSLSFGPSLEVDLRATAAGIEVVLRAEPRLARAAEAELPRVVAALRARGVAVARAEVRRGPGAR
jgi:hypothetical protein